MIKAKCILIADDRLADIGLIQYVLGGHDLEGRSEVVRDGQEVLDYLFCCGAYNSRPPGNPKLILLDLRLPKVSGLDILKRIRADERVNSVPVVIFSSSSHERDRAEALAHGAVDFVVKPLNLDEFSETLIRTIHTYIK
jgi:two-component system, response regulator